ncbi:MAG: PKD domain-containing protein, partial [Anaerolineales bacterium]
FGDGVSLTVDDVKSFPHTTSYPYSVSGDYEWTLSVVDSSDPQKTGTALGKVTIGPTVTLIADVMPTFLILDSGEVTANFTAQVSGGTSPFTYKWNFVGESDFAIGPDAITASATYTVAGKFTASVTVTDGCGLTTTDTLLIVVFDPQTSCHPRARQIADAVNSLYPNQAETLYTCVDIYEIFLGSLTGTQTGFGRLWHAYQLASTIEDLTWEQIRDWKLDGTGWGLLVQLDRFADAIDEVGIADLIDRVLSGENTVGQIRTALRNVVRYEANFEDALSRLADGASPGEMGQFYRLAQEMDLTPEILDSYLELGISMSELKHAAKLAAQTDGDWATLAAAHAAGNSWGEIGQAYRLADEDTEATEILEIGIQEFRRQQREEVREESETERDLRTAVRLAEQYDVNETEVMDVFNNHCDADWSCVRSHFREQARGNDQTEQDQHQRTSARLASQYGVSEEDVMGLFNGECQGDWNCVRSYLRDQAREERGKDKD